MFIDFFCFCDYVDVELNVMLIRYVGYKMVLKEEIEIRYIILNLLEYIEKYIV